MNVNNVESVLIAQETKRNTKEFTLGRILMNVNSVAGGLAKQDT